MALTTTFGMDWTSAVETLSPHIRFIRSIDWAATALGPHRAWPQQLHQMLDLILADPTPSAIMWGEDLTMIYNEGFVEFAGLKHPLLMGGSPIISYAEVWEPMFAPIVKHGRATGQAIRHNDVPLSLMRHGYTEECFVDYSFVPVLGPDKVVIGFYHTAIETTNQNLSKRRMKTLIDIGDYAGTARSMKEYWEAVLKGFEPNVWDVPYAIAWEFRIAGDGSSTAGSGLNSAHGSTLEHVSSGSSSGARPPTLCSLAGIMGKHITQIPLALNVSDEDDSFQQVVGKAMRSGQLALISIEDGNMPNWLESHSVGRAFDEPCKSAVVIPVRPTSRIDAKGTDVAGFMVLGINPRRAFDDDYERYVRLWSRQMDTSAASVVLLEQEVKRQKKLTAQLTISTRHIQESEARFARFAEMSTIGMWILDPAGTVIFSNNAWREQMKFMEGNNGLESWKTAVAEESWGTIAEFWAAMNRDKVSSNFEVRIKGGPLPGEQAKADVWLLSSVFPELDADGCLKAVWGVNTDISHQKLAEDLKEQRLLDVLEAKRQSESFIDTVSHEMRNPLSAILQCADGIDTALTEARAASSGQKFTLLDKEAVEHTLESAQTIILCAQHQKRIINDILTLSKLDARLLVVTPVETDPIETVRHALRLHQQEFQNADVENGILIESSYRSLGVDRVFVDPSRLLQVLINLLSNAIKFTQFQAERRITVHLGASVADSVEPRNSEDYFDPRRSESRLKLGPDWGSGEVLLLHFSVNDTGCGLSGPEMQSLFLRFSQASPKTHVKYGGSGLGLFICKELTEMQGGRIGVSSTPGKGSNFRFFIKARRAKSPTVSNLIDKATEQFRRAALDPPKREEKPQEQNTNQDSLHVQDRNYVAPMNRSHSASQNPVVGSATDPDTLHVLVVEDNLINQRVMTQQLKKAKCIVHVANHGADALLFLEKTTFARDTGPTAIPLSIVLMDLEMPVMDGLTCVRKIRDWQKSGKLTKPVPVIAVTANARTEQIVMAKEAGMDDVVTKPFRIPDLIPQMHNLIEKTSA